MSPNDPPSTDDSTPSKTAGSIPSGRLGPGFLLAGRYRIESYVARGGMGTVYRAWDREFQQTIAVKVLRPELAASESTLKRFRREIQVARRVTHPNVCRIYDFGKHPSTGRKPPILFLTMEFVPGETLAERLADQRPLPLDEAESILRQIAKALDTAHSVGVVHRDLTSGNVILDDEKSPMRAVMTDFGISRDLRASGQAADRITQSGQLLGTPAYVAPEQLRGDDVSTLSDIYSLGVLAYEMVTGKVPFRGENAVKTALKRLREDPEPPARANPTLPPAWNSAILKALAREPQERFQSAGAFIDALEEPKSAEPNRPYRWTAALALLALLSGGAWVGYQLLWPHSVPRASTAKAPMPVQRRTTIAVLPLRDLTTHGGPATAWLSTALATMLTTELSAGADARPVSGLALKQVRTQINRGGDLPPSAESLSRMRESFGIDYVVIGSYRVGTTGDSHGLLLQIEVLDTATGRRIATHGDAGSDLQLLHLVSQVGRTIRRILGLRAPSGTAVSAVRAILPESPAAVRHYALGLQNLQDDDALSAKTELQAAVDVERNFPLAWSALADAWSRLGFDARALDAASRAHELSRGLRREDRLRIDGQYAQIRGDWAQAIQIYRTLTQFFPDDLEYGLKLVHALIENEQGGDAVRVAESLQARGEAESHDPRVSLARAQAAAAVADNSGRLSAAMEALQRAEAADAIQIAASAQLEIGSARLDLGDPDGAEAAYLKARRLYVETGDQGGAALALTDLAHVQEGRGALPPAVDRYREALAVYRGLGDQSHIAGTLRRIADNLRRQGLLVEAESNLEEALATYRSIHDLRGVTTTLNNLGVLAWDKGDSTGAGKIFGQLVEHTRTTGNRRDLSAALNNLAIALSDSGDQRGALERYRESLAIDREIGHRAGAADTLNNIAMAEWQLGDLGGANRDFQEALEIYTDIDDRSSQALVRSNLGELAMDRGNLQEAREALQDGLDLRDELGEQAAAMESRLALALLDLDEGHSERAVEAARGAARFLEQHQNFEDAAWGYALLGRALIASNDLAGADAAIASANRLVKRTSQIEYVLSVRIESARLDIARKRDQTAISTLREVIRQSRSAQLMRQQLRARLLLTRALADAGHQKDAESERQRLSEDAQHSGFLEIARRSHATDNG